MKSKKIFFIVFLVVSFLLFLLIGYFFVNDKIQEKKLQKEIADLAQLDIGKDRYQKEIKTKGDFAVLEKAILNYLDEFSTNTQKVLEIVQNDEIAALLSASNYQENGPEFLTSIRYINKMRQEINTEIDQLIFSCNEESIMKFIMQYELNDYYISLYRSLMFGNVVQEDLQEAKEQLLYARTRINLVFDVSLEVFEFLKQNASAWKIEDNQIMFQTEGLVNDYNLLVSKIKDPQ